MARAEKEISKVSISKKPELKVLAKRPPVDKEAMASIERKTPLYKIYEYSKEELIQAQRRMAAEAILIGGMPKNHSEVFEKRGWLLPFLMSYDQLFTGRWDYWLDIVEKGTIDGSGPIPQIEWCKNTNSIHQVMKMLYDCMNHVYYDGATVEDFADWILWGLAGTNEPPKVSAKVNEHWYRTFDLALVMKYPTDYMSALLEEETSHNKKSSLGYFSTPPSLTQLMTELVYYGRDREEMKYESFYEACCGCGAMMLPASNYNLFGAGQDINPAAVKLCRIQMYWYAPWFAFNPLQRP